MLRKLKIFLKFPEINHFITTNRGGVSLGKYKGLNLALHTGDNKDNVLENRRLLAETIGKRVEDFVYLNQTHGSEVFVVEEKDKGRGSLVIDENLSYDSIITNKKGIVLIVLVADCVPIIIFDEVKKVIGVIHSGWKGTKYNILKKTIEKSCEKFGTNKKDIIVGIGPSISKNNYEVGEEVALNFENKFYIKKDNNKYNLDLQKIIKNQALEVGISEENIEIYKKCTLDNKDLFFSARREGLNSGRFGMGIYLN